MFIYITYKDAPELSSLRARSSEAMDSSVEKTLLVNPNCPVRIMLEYIRKKCRLGKFTQFDLCDEGGVLKGLFSLQTYAYATDQFEHKSTYYVIVLKIEPDRRYSVLPQLNHENRIYFDLKMRVKKYLMTADLSSSFLNSAPKTSTIATPTLTNKTAATTPVKTGRKK
ncbi:uncharacterized protein LOC124642021 [Helicoverpa zea]|uniref:uncharacterized protein LOC124642021 n=1 Tax=Helicoverpa zea TaxID=7113 RepID=UPI001F566E29|nr:uncharacterized protein LOC124642021 [Helicoverpa zea]